MYTPGLDFIRVVEFSISKQQTICTRTYNHIPLYREYVNRKSRCDSFNNLLWEFRAIDFFPPSSISPKHIVYKVIF